MDKFAEIAERRFIDETIEHLRVYFPAECSQESEQEVRTKAELAVANAKRLGFVSRCDVSRFVDLVWAFGPRVTEHPQLGPLLVVDMDPTLKMDRACFVALELADGG